MRITLLALLLTACGGRKAQTTTAPTEPAVAAKAADGASCATASDCESGVCEGTGCDEAHLGTCMPVHRGCTKDLVAFCTCEGETIRTSSRCPGTRVRARGACEE